MTNILEKRPQDAMHDWCEGLTTDLETLMFLLNSTMTLEVHSMLCEVVTCMVEKDDEANDFTVEYNGFRFQPFEIKNGNLKGNWGIRCTPTVKSGNFHYAYLTRGEAEEVIERMTDIERNAFRPFDDQTYRVNFSCSRSPVALRKDR